MSRPLNFRAWDKNNKKMVGPGIHVFIDMWIPLPSIAGQNAILMQYTGLKDKNSKEMYDRDIVKVFEGTKHYRIDTIIWNEYSASFVLAGSQGGHLFGGEQIEVIGNIWENGDLLK